MGRFAVALVRRLAATASLAFSVAASVGVVVHGYAQDEPATDAAAEVPAPGSPPAKRARGEPVKFEVSLDGSAIAIAVRVDSETHQIGHFDSGESDGTELWETTDFILDVELTPNGRHVFVHAVSRETAKRRGLLKMFSIGDPIRHRVREYPIIQSGVPSITPGPGPSHVTLSYLPEAKVTVIDLETGEDVPPDDVPTLGERLSRTSADGRVHAKIRLYEVVVTDVASDAELMRIECDVTSKNALRYSVLGVSAAGETVVLQAEKLNSRVRDPPTWLEGWDTAKGERRWQIKDDVFGDELIVGPDTVATLVKGRLSVYDIHTGRKVKLAPITKPLAEIGTGGDRRLIWAASTDGHIFPVQYRDQ